MQARYISSFLRGLRVFQSASVIPLIWFFARPGHLRTEGWEAEFLALLSTVGTLLVAYFLLECFTRLRHRPVDIFIACRKGLIPELTALLDEGTDANRRLLDATRQTPLHIAAAAGSSECVTALLQHGADPLLCDVEDETALHKACRRGDARCIRAFLHPPNDTPCVLRGDHLECTLQANKSGLIARQLLSPKADGSLAEELMACEHGEAPLVGRTCSTQMEQSIPRRPTTPVEATEIFGKVLKDSSSRFLVDETSSDNSNLTGFLFSTGVGERMAEVLGADQRFAEEQPVQLTALRTQGVLGAGAFGKVFKVLDVASSEVYALKLQRRDRASKFAIREAKALHRSSHAFIVRLIHIFQTQSYYALLMELCDKSLNACILDHVSATGRLEGLPEDLARRYAACITLALEYLHQQKVVFRDLKPDNVLVTFQDNVAKLADFGLARSLDPSFLDKGADPDSDNDEKALSPYSSTVCGTPRFMAPEVYDEPKFYDSEDEEESAIKRVLSRDWYAMGCCMLLMLLGQHGGSLAEMKGRRVLLPPSGQQEITCALRKASKKGRMEDAVSISDNVAGHACFAVFDGHGGEKATVLAKQFLPLQLEKLLEQESSKEEAAHQAFAAMDERMQKQLAEEDELVLLNLGDCKAVVCENGKVGTTTRDHHPEKNDQEKQRLEELGVCIEGGYVDGKVTKADNAAVIVVSLNIPEPLPKRDAPPSRFQRSSKTE
ncbi:ATPK2 [Symbiodinium microadriaticum]|nr:ATPK2 [Symbiodinium microadriaticum]